MSKGFWIFLAAGITVVGGLIFTMLTATQGAHLRLEGKILKVRVLALPGGTASIVVVDFRVTNPSNVPFVVNSVTLHLKPATGEDADGTTISRNDIANIFRYEKLLGQKYNETLSLQDRIPPHKIADLMTGARFEVPEGVVNSRKSIRVQIDDVDGTSAEITE